ncbi:DUF72 domain-containing protein [Sandaracinus amylolyticus]|uniref:DUF72 domain-containing protein n=1 Tax=Sandaracinus amylolyticus TaxID=927083 RepID=UPI001F2B297C|nr:DUF72 domain-containing protein [Sandaracinus amylolyticus]UJR80018.1 DUF72 domain-containing protein [Sandaracinus amylolyticus]
MHRKGTQLDLFGGETPPPSPPPPRPIAPRPRRGELDPIPAPDPTLVALASRLPRHVRLGTSSWTFPGWAGHVYRRRYPNERVFTQRSLEEYAQFPLFRTVGIDRSFWAPIPEHELEAYAAQLPDGFRCAMKVWEEITTVSYPSHPRYGARAGQLNPHFLDARVFRELIAEPVARAFGRHLGAFVLEIPPPPKLPHRPTFERQLARFFEEVPRHFHYAVELRDKRLLTRRHVELLRAHGASHVWNHWSRMPPISMQREIAGAPLGPIAIARLMLPQDAQYEAQKAAMEPFDTLVAPDPEMRADVIRLARECEDAGAELYVIVNNKVEGSSPWTVRALAERLAR